jgi:hypothetical protein
VPEGSGGIELLAELAGARGDIGMNQRQHGQLNIVTGSKGALCRTSRARLTPIRPRAIYQMETSETRAGQQVRTAGVLFPREVAYAD